MKPLNLFYDEADPDRWLPFDRFPRRAIRQLIRGPARVSGHRLVFLNLCRGLDRLGVTYRVNDYRYARNHPGEVVGIIGEPFVLDVQAWKNPILFGASVFSHPLDDPRLCQRLPVRRILVPGEWMQQMFEPAYGSLVSAWPTGIDTDTWTPSTTTKDIDFLIYDKVRWQHDQFAQTLITPVTTTLQKRGLKIVTLRYGFYRESDFRSLLTRCRAMVFLCEHETQGIAYQQTLACDVPILAWDRGGYWEDPTFFPDRVQFSPVSSVPYWDERCGMKFVGAADFDDKLDKFLAGLESGQFAPRAYILENLTLENCASQYLEFMRQVQAEFAS